MHIVHKTRLRYKMLIESLCTDQGGIIFVFFFLPLKILIVAFFGIFFFFIRMLFVLNTILEHCSVSLVASVKALLSRNFRLSDNVRGIRRTPWGELSMRIWWLVQLIRQVNRLVSYNYDYDNNKRVYSYFFFRG